MTAGEPVDMSEERVRRVVRSVLADGKKKTVYRDGKRKKKLDCRDGYKAKDGKCVKMSSSEKRNRSRAAKKSAKKKTSSTKSKAARKRKRTDKKR